MLTGNDLSEFQGQVTFDTYKNNSNFVIIRATIGTARIDKQLPRNRDEARRVGLPLGYYHYAYPQYNTPEAEANYCATQLQTIRDGEIVALDFEEAWTGNPVDFCKRWLDRFSSRMNGMRPLVYLNQALIKANNWKPVVDGGYGLWVAAYTLDPNNNTFTTGAWKFAAMQQWTDKQQVPGVTGNVDGDVFFGDAATFHKYGYKSPAPTPPPPPQPDYKALYEKAQGKLDRIKAITNE